MGVWSVRVYGLRILATVCVWRCIQLPHMRDITTSSVRNLFKKSYSKCLLKLGISNMAGQLATKNGWLAVTKNGRELFKLWLAGGVKIGSLMYVRCLSCGWRVG